MKALQLNHQDRRHDEKHQGNDGFDRSLALRTIRGARLANLVTSTAVVPTWNYIVVHAYGPVAFFQDSERLLDVVTRLTNRHETARANPWAVGDAPADFVAGQLRGIVGVRIPVTRFEGKRKMSQNRPAGDRLGVAAGLAASAHSRDREVAALISLPP